MLGVERMVQENTLMFRDSARAHHWTRSAARYVLTPGRYVGVEEQEEDREPFEEKMRRLTAKLREQMIEGRMLDTASKPA